LLVSKSRIKWGHLILPITATLALIADQASKYIIASSLERFEEWAPIPSLQWLFAITYTTNTGAAFGLFPNSGALFIVIAVVVVIAIFIYYRQLATQQRLLRFSLGLQLGGALGNLLDRLTRGYVVDFIHFKFWPVFNVADSCIVVGVALMAYFLLKEGQAEANERQETMATGGSDQENSGQNLSTAS
jgi:signal peptidase II